ncbi:MAG: excinuclease ABC subunit UvrA [Cytophagales bacterium]|nr:excinuclease ABC subunit UvrA [Cytophagales bacterium]
MPIQEVLPKKKPITKDIYGYEYVEVWGAREHNLKNINVKFPRNKLVVITGVSGSGKSSLAFDTIHAEGQRRYMESFAAYARNFIGDIKRPDVDKIDGISPVIAIEQKTTSRNPRSTVGTVTEIYDLMRLLFARAAEAYSYLSGEKMIKQSDEQIQRHILKTFSGKQLTLLAPVVKGRKGHYRELFQQIRKMGFNKVSVDGEIKEVVPKMQVDRYKTHDIAIVIDRVVVNAQDKQRIRESLHMALQHGKGVVMLQEKQGQLHYFSKLLMDPKTGLSYDEPAPNNFSFNSPYGACPTCDGLGEVTEINQASIIPDDRLSISRGGIAPLGIYRDIWIFKKIEALLKKNHLNLSVPIKDIPKDLLHTILYGDNIEVVVDSVKYPGTKWNTKFEGVIHFLEKRKETKSGKKQSVAFSHTKVCPDCKGARLKKASCHFKINHKNIAELATMDIQQLHDWFSHLESKLNERQKSIATELLKEIRKRIHFLRDVGLHYLHLNRPLRTLSGGEAQRIRLATQIGTQLTGVLYILDEPSIGLHQRDNMRLINALKELRDIGNSVLVVEHDKDMMLHSDYILDIGPGAGKYGGEIVAAAAPEKFINQHSATADFLKGKQQIAVSSQRRVGNGKYLIVKGCQGNNLKNITLKIPLGRMVCVTGVSGSGKSTLIHETLFPILSKHLYRAVREPLPYEAIEGIAHIDKVVEVDQSPIGRTPRSNPATYIGVFADIRSLFTYLPEAKIRGYKPGRFSFNVKGGRCETCEGAGLKLIEMDFLPTVHVACETCKGKRYNRETLEVQYKGKSIADVLAMTVNSAVTFFEKYPQILRKVKTLQDVGLGYITLGQHATTLSGGEAQRVKLATELAKKDTGKTLYILDEPTTGLHFQDIQLLLHVLHKLVDKGNTVLIIEHNMDIIKVADHIIDLGLEGGGKGGEIVCEGTPEEIIHHTASHTATFLSKELRS